MFYKIKINKNNLSFRFNINNLFNTLYLAELNTNTLDANGNLYTLINPNFTLETKATMGLVELGILVLNIHFSTIEL